MITLFIGIKIEFSYKNSKGCLKILILKKINIYSTDFKNNEDNNNENRDVKKLLKLSEPCFKYFKIFLKKIIKATTFDKLECHLIFGLDDFADTGKYIGYIWAIFAILNTAIPNAQLSGQANFLNELKLNLEIIVNINFLKLIIPLISLISKKEIRELIKGVRNG